MLFSEKLPRNKICSYILRAQLLFLMRSAKMKIGNICPYCGGELLSGYLQSARQIIWSQEEKSISFRADEEGDLVVSRGIWERQLCRLSILRRLRHFPAGAPRAAAEIRRAPARKVWPGARRRHDGIKQGKTARGVCRARSHFAQKASQSFAVRGHLFAVQTLKRK